MKKIYLIIVLTLFTISTNVFSLTQDTQNTTQQEQQKLQIARDGCQKAIGFFPTPSKLMCLLTALGISEQDVKPKALALVFSVCHGRTLQPVPAGLTAKKYNTLSACLSDPMAIKLINNELTSQGFTPVKVVNQSVLVTGTK